MKYILFFIFSLLLILPFQSALADHNVYIQSGNLAVGGYDTVAYFTQNRALKGNSKFKTTWHGAEWYFSSAENLEAFRASPEKYAPQYGGYCAFAVAHGQLAHGDPLQWHIENGKLYLNLNAGIKKQWLEKRAKFIPQADKNYPGL